MAGFGKFTVVSEYFDQSIINILWYRSDNLTWIEGNLFEQSQNITDTVANTVVPAFQSCMLADVTIQRIECTPYSDALAPLLGSPLIHTVNVNGSRGSLATNGAAQAATLGLKCGIQHQITGVTKSKRNRGYLSIGPLADAWVDNYGHLTDAMFNSQLENLANVLTDTIIILDPPCDLVPVRIHRIKTLGVWTGVTYSDIIGYAMPRKATFRRSRLPEA